MAYRTNIYSKDTKELMQVALGKSKADLAIVNATLLNVYTGEVLKKQSICVKNQWIAYVGSNPQESIGPQTTIVDAHDKTVIPGLIDGHTHIAWLYNISEFLTQVIPGGTTTIITETLEPYPVAGIAGVIDFLEALAQQPIKIWATAPPMVSISRSARGISATDLQLLLDRNDIIGLGETYWQALLQEPERFLPLFEQTIRAGKILEGHTAGASEKKLQAYLAPGITSCHEPIKASEVLDRLRLGIHVMVREGSIRRDLEEIAKIKDAGADLRRLLLVTDGVAPQELIEKGYMEYVVQKAINCGFNPVSAIQMATLNVAEHFHLDHLIGGIAPGRYADMLIIPDINTIQPDMVISNGCVIARNKKLTLSPREHQFSSNSLNTVRLKQDLTGNDFQVTAPNPKQNPVVRTIEMVTDLVTGEGSAEMLVSAGTLASNVDRDILKVAAIDRSNHPGRMFVGFIRGFGLQAGALASSAAWDTSDIVVVGADDNDMALAVNRIRKLQGGVVVCQAGEIKAELSLPVFGLMSDEPINNLISKMGAIRSAVADLGVKFPDPLLSIITLTGAAIPFLRICEEGLVDLKSGETVGLFVEN
ncbi:MAG: adenine deaminase C-terminal domain-containing protein [Desulfobacterales bacterium]|nr:adenine deaminase C-terminal domain-containing protein [Desulfobacterales bacterium]